MIRLTQRRLAAMGVAMGAFASFCASAQAETVLTPAEKYQIFFRSSVCGAPFSDGGVTQRCLDTQDSSRAGTAAEFASLTAASQSSLNPSQALAAADSALSAAQALANETEQRLEAMRDRPGGKAGAADDSIGRLGNVNLFAGWQGEWFNKDRPQYANERGFDGSRHKGTVGADFEPAPGSRIGLMLSYDRNALTFDSEAAVTSFAPQGNAGGNKSRTWTVTAFASAAIGEGGWLDIAAGHGWSDNAFRRRATFVPLTIQQGNAVAGAKALDVDAFGSAKGRHTFITAGAGFDSQSGALSFGPYARLRYVHSRISAYEETDGRGSGLEMGISAQKTTIVTGVLGGRVSGALSTSWGVIVPQARIEYEHGFKGDAREVSAYFVRDNAPGVAPLQLTSDRPDRNFFNLGAGLAFVLPHGVMPYVDYEALVGYSGFTRHRVSLGLRVAL